jgi:hypothetical protein
MSRPSRSLAALVLSATLLPAAASAGADQKRDALHFFVGATEGMGTTTVLMRKPYHSHSTGIGVIKADGSLYLVQRTHDDGALPKIRRWLIRQVGPRRFSGTMSEATGPVDVQEIGGNYRFRFNMKGHLSVEEWMVPDAGGRSATTHTSIRKFGFPVAKLEGVVRKIG